MEQQTKNSQTEIYQPITSNPQIVYLDFDGDNAIYNNTYLGLNFNVDIENSGLDQERIDSITAQLNRQYSDKNVVFVTDVPVEEEYSTVYVGNTDAFDAYGEFYGLAETIDVNNNIQDDNAFAIVDHTYSNAQIISVISHETDHIVSGGESHDDQVDTIDDFAMDKYLYTETYNDYVEVVYTRKNGVSWNNSYWTPEFKNGATKVVITVSNNSCRLSNAYQYSYNSSLMVQRVVGMETRENLIQINHPMVYTMYSGSYQTLTLSQPSYLIDSVAVTNTFTITAKYYTDIEIADLIISSENFSRTSLDTLRFDPSESFTYSFTVKNAGDLKAGASKAIIYVDGKNYAEVAINALNKGASETYTYKFAAGVLKNGSHKIYVSADGYGVINEFSESNNDSSGKEFIVETAMADLAVCNFTIADANGVNVLATDKSISVAFEVQNRSANKKSTATTATLYVNGKVIKTFNVGEIATEKTAKFTHTIPAGTLTAGNIEFKLVLDTANSCKEYNENNNSYTTTQTLHSPIKPDLQIKNITFSNTGKDALYADEPVNVTIDIQNYINGKAELGRSSIATEAVLYCGDKELKRFSVPALGANKTCQLTCSIPAGLLPEGENSFSVVIDPDKKCAEGNENNNNIETTRTFNRLHGVDLAVSELKISDWTKEGRIVTFSVTNNGDETSNPVIVTIDANYENTLTTRLSDIEVGKLAPGESRAYSYTVAHKGAFNDAGTVQISIDSFDINKDKNISNNTVVSESFGVDDPTIWEEGRKYYYSVRLDNMRYHKHNPEPDIFPNLFDVAETVEWTDDYIYICYDTYDLPKVYTPDTDIFVDVYVGDNLLEKFQTTNYYKNFEGDWVQFAIPTSLLANGKQTLRVLAYTSKDKLTGDCYYDGGYWYIFNLDVKSGNPDLPAAKEWKPPVDLAVTSAKMTCRKDLGNAQQLTFTVKNVGQYTAGKGPVSESPGYKACLYDTTSKKLIASYHMPVIDIGKSIDFSFTLNESELLAAGKHNLSLVIEPGETSTDINTTNNTFNFVSDNMLAPVDKPKVYADTTAKTDLVTVRAVFTDGTVKKEYSLDNKNWKPYTYGIQFKANGTVYFRGTNEQGKVSEVASYTVNNIVAIADTVKPVISSVILQQGADNYVFTANVNASDNTTTTANLKYQIKYSSTQAGLSGATAISGKSFTLNETAVGKNYYYQVGVADEAGNIAWSEAKSFNVKKIVPVVANDAVKIYGGVPAKLTSQASHVSDYPLTPMETMYVSSGGIASKTTVWGKMYVSSGGMVKNTTVADFGYTAINNGGIASNTKVNSAGQLIVSSGGTHRGSLQIQSSAVVSAYQGAIIDFTLAERSAGADYIVNNLALISGAPTYTITVSPTQASGIYQLAQGASSFKGTISIGDGSIVYGNVSVNTSALNYNNTTYLLEQKNGNLTLSIKGANAPVNKKTPDSNLLKNGVSQIVAWDKEKGAVGFVATDGTPGNKWRGIWDWDGKDVELWRVVGVGHFKGSTVDHDGILLYNGIGTTFAAWTNLNDPSYGYVNLCHVEGNFNTKCLTDLDSDQYDDVLIYDEKGSFGVVLDGATYKDIWHVDDAKTNQWTLRGAGNFGGKEEKLVVENKSGHLYLWQNNDTTFKTWNWSQTAIGYLGNDFEFVATGDFMGDGTDDILVRNTKDGGIWMWDNGDSTKAHWEVTPGKGFKAEAVGDYNGDGKDDLLVREYNTGWGGLGYYAFGSDKLWNDLNARIETDLESKFAVIA